MGQFSCIRMQDRLPDGLLEGALSMQKKASGFVLNSRVVSVQIISRRRRIAVSNMIHGRNSLDKRKIVRLSWLRVNSIRCIARGCTAASHSRRHGAPGGYECVWKSWQVHLTFARAGCNSLLSPMELLYRYFTRNFFATVAFFRVPDTRDDSGSCRCA